MTIIRAGAEVRALYRGATSITRAYRGSELVFAHPEGSTYAITALASPISIGETHGEHAMRFLPGSDRVVVMTYVSDTNRQVQVYEVNRSTGAITALSSPLTFYSSSQALSTQGMDLIAYDATHFLAVWRGAGGDGFARSFEVDASTGAVTAWGSQVEFDTNHFDVASLYNIPGEANRFLVTGMRANTRLGAQVITVNTSDGALTFQAGAWNLGEVGWAISADFLDSTRLLLVYGFGPDTDFYARVLEVGTDWSVNAIGSETEIRDGVSAGTSTVLTMSASVAVVLTKAIEGTYLHVLSVNAGTGAVAHLDTPVQIAAGGIDTTSVHALKKLDEDHFVVFFSGVDNDGYARTYHVDVSTGALTMLHEIEFETGYCTDIRVDDLGGGLFAAVWLGPDGVGYLQAFQVK